MRHSFQAMQTSTVYLRDVEAASVLDECARTSSALLSMAAVGRHDLAGQTFNRLIAERKLLAAFYTSIPASTLLAGLALSPDRWASVDWSKGEDIAEMVVVDPACGTGTLLMAAYRQIVQNHTTAAANPDHDLLHRALVEKVIMGADVVQAATHLTAATLAAMSPSVQFKEMQLHTLRLDYRQNGKQDLFRGAQSKDVYAGLPCHCSKPSATAVHLSHVVPQEQIGGDEWHLDSIVQRPQRRTS